MLEWTLGILGAIAVLSWFVEHPVYEDTPDPEEEAS